MKIKLRHLTVAQRAAAQGTAFTYQGHLISGTTDANGDYDLTFELFDASSSGSQVGNTVTNLDVGVTNGLFTVTADFGAVFNGTAYWLQIGVRTKGSGSNSTVGGGGFDGNEDDDPLGGNAALGGGDVVCGGVGNGTANLDSAVGGGIANVATGDYSVVPGGYYNSAAGTCSFAAGNNANANFPGQKPTKWICWKSS